MATGDNLDPKDWPAFRAQARQMLDDILDYVEFIRDRPVWQPIPDEVRALFHEGFAAGPSQLSDVHAEFLGHILPFTTGNVHPGFMGWAHGGGTPVGIVAEMLAAGLNANLGGRDHVPIEVETQIVRWVRDLFGFPATATGLFVTGTSLGNLIAVLVARTAALGEDVRSAGVGGSPLTAYTSAAAHSSVAQAFDLAGLGTAALRIVPVNADHQIDIAALKRAIAADRANGRAPFMVVGTAGTVEIGAIDDLAGLADVAYAEGLWLHIDGAFGALGMLAPEIAPRLAGIGDADSIALDFHKWGQVPYDAGFVLVRDGALHQRTFANSAGYLRREARGLAAGALWPSDLGPDLSRGFRALKTWFTLKVHGTAAIGHAIQRSCELARYLAERVDAMPELERMAPVGLNIVCFRYRCADPDVVNRNIVADLHESGIAAPSTAVLAGQVAIRAALFNHRSEPRDVDALLDAVLKFGRARVSGGPPAPAAMTPRPSGLAALARMALQGADLRPLTGALESTVAADPRDAKALMDLSILRQFAGDPAGAMALQARALAVQQLYRFPAAVASARPLRLLVLQAVGDLMANTPVEFLVQRSDVDLIVQYVDADRPMPAELPPHDVVFVAISQSDPNQPVLRRLKAWAAMVALPVLNAPERVARLTREGASELLRGAPGLVMPETVRVIRQQLAGAAANCRPGEPMLGTVTFPILVRPVGSHAGKSLARIDMPAEVAAYLLGTVAGEFYVAPFVDYRSPDGRYRKVRIAFIDGRPLVAHMAVSDHWMIHYLNANMAADAGKRAEEAKFMAAFDRDFARRHRAALAAIADRVGLEYFGLDCGETQDGRLLVFEADTGMIVHDMDPVDVYPYKQPQMDKVFRAFRAMLERHRGGATV